MQPHKTLFEEQKNKNIMLASQSEVEEEQLSFIKFETGKTAYLIAIAGIREITDQTRITPYPETTPGHLGLISLRGEILPVIQLETDEQPSDADRLIVIEFEPGSPFCLKASHIKKVSLPESRVKEESIFNIDSKAACILDASHPLLMKRIEA